MKKKPFSELVIGVAFILLGICVVILAGSLNKVKLGIGPGGFPTFIAILMILLGAGQTIATLRAGFEAPAFTADRRQTLLFLCAVALAVLYVLLVPVAGFLLATPVLVFCMMMLYGNRKYLLCAAISILSTVAVWLLFTRVFLIFLPAGRLLR